jgi:hypothetical protein
VAVDCRYSTTAGRSIEDEIDRTALHETKKFIVGVLSVSTVKGMIVTSSGKKLQKEGSPIVTSASVIDSRHRWQYKLQHKAAVHKGDNKDSVSNKEDQLQKRLIK